MMPKNVMKKKGLSTSRSRPPFPIKLERETLALQATSKIREAILGTEFSPGEPLREQVLAERLDVSRQVVRECLSRLEADGLVENDPFRGRYVIDLDQQDIAQLLPLRVMLECYAVELAVQNLTREMEVELQTLLSKIYRPGLTFGEFKELDRKIHETIWLAANNRPLIRLLRQVATPFFMLATYSKLAPYTSAEDVLRKESDEEVRNYPSAHGPLINAMCNRDAENAIRMMREHIMPWEKRIGLQPRKSNGQPRSRRRKIARSR